MTTARGPKPWPSRGIRTPFLRVPPDDYPAIAQGHKTEFRTSGRYSAGLFQYEHILPIPAEVANLRKDGKIHVLFAAADGGLAGGVFDVRLMRK